MVSYYDAHSFFSYNYFNFDLQLICFMDNAVPRHNQVGLARELAGKLNSDLKEKYPGYSFSKSWIRLNYELPGNVSTLVFTLLECNYGFRVSRNHIRIPKPEPVAEAIGEDSDAEQITEI